MGTVNLGDGAGAITVNGTAGPDSIVVTPTSAGSATIQANEWMLIKRFTAIPTSNSFWFGRPHPWDPLRVSGGRIVTLEPRIMR